MPVYAIWETGTGRLLTVKEGENVHALELPKAQSFTLLLEVPDLFFVKWDTCKRRFVERCVYGRGVWLGKLLDNAAYVEFYIQHGNLEPYQQLERLDEIETILRTI